MTIPDAPSVPSAEARARRSSSSRPVSGQPLIMTESYGGSIRMASPRRGYRQFRSAREVCVGYEWAIDRDGGTSEGDRI